MKQILSMALVLVLLLTFTACAAQPDYSSGDERSPAFDNDQPADSDAPSGALPGQRQIIRNARLDLVAEDVLATYEQLLAFVQQRGGYEAERSQSQTDQYLSIDASLRLPPAELDAFMAYAEEIADVINTRINTEDITAAYFDAKTRLESMERSLLRYYEFLDAAENIEESLAVQSQINDLTVEIESLKGRLALWDSQLQESTVVIRLRQLDDPLQLQKEIDWSALSFSDMGYLMQAGLKTVLNVLIAILQWGLIILVATSPLWLTGLLIIIILRRKARKRRMAQPSANQPIQPPQQQPPPGANPPGPQGT